MRINPEKMAGLYWSMMRGKSIWEVDGKIKAHEHCPITRDYWLIVRTYLEAFSIPKERRH